MYERARYTNKRPKGENIMLPCLEFCSGPTPPAKCLLIHLIEESITMFLRGLCLHRGTYIQ